MADCIHAYFGPAEFRILLIGLEPSVSTKISVFLDLRLHESQHIKLSVSEKSGSGLASIIQLVYILSTPCPDFSIKPVFCNTSASRLLRGVLFTVSTLLLSTPIRKPPAFVLVNAFGQNIILHNHRSVCDGIQHSLFSRHFSRHMAKKNNIIILFTVFLANLPDKWREKLLTHVINFFSRQKCYINRHCIAIRYAVDLPTPSLIRRSKSTRCFNSRSAVLG